ncbi:hypothetical protein E6O75_ATG05016 [Venturia nashicola]|uniref:Uncharacterized protein n=1 Tax=Venturia nashicola TaxID=86259 RepID=A0A4Z1P9L6_9PEZI|nr:hypothetical protein E6O75_ATG05016 [Venturia nashicola]
MYNFRTLVLTTTPTFFILTTANPTIAGLRGQSTANIDYCKEKDYQDCVFGVSRAANDCISLPDNYTLMSVKFKKTVKCQIFTDKQCGFKADVTMRYVRLEEQTPDLSPHNTEIGGYFQSLREEKWDWGENEVEVEILGSGGWADDIGVGKSLIDVRNRKTAANKECWKLGAESIGLTYPLDKYDLAIDLVPLLNPDLGCKFKYHKTPCPKSYPPQNDDIRSTPTSSTTSPKSPRLESTMKLFKTLLAFPLAGSVLAQQPYCQIKCATPMIAACSGISSSVLVSSEDFKCACCLPNYASCGTNTAGLCCSGRCEAGHCRPVLVQNFK